MRLKPQPDCAAGTGSKGTSAWRTVPVSGQRGPVKVCITGPHRKDRRKDATLRVRYEDGVKTPRSELDRFAGHLDTQRERSVNADAESLPVFGSSELGHGETGAFTKVTVARPNDFNPVGRWQSWLGVTRETFKDFARDMLIRRANEAGGP